MKNKKLWVCIGIALTGIGSTIAGIVTGVTIENETLSLVLTIAGMALTGLGGVAYEISDALVDVAAIKLQQAAITAKPELVEQIATPQDISTEVTYSIRSGGTD